MATSRDWLQDENNLLLDFEKLASGRPGGEDWAQFFSDWRGINEGLIAKSDSDLEAATAEDKPAGVQFSEQLATHAQTEEEISYPTALLIGRYVKSRTSDCAP